MVDLRKVANVEKEKIETIIEALMRLWHNDNGSGAMNSEKISLSLCFHKCSP